MFRYPWGVKFRGKLRNYHQVLRFCQLVHYVHGRLNSFIMMDTSLLSFESFAGDLLLKSSLYFNTFGRL